jgi:hypothetical protein
MFNLRKWNSQRDVRRTAVQKGPRSQKGPNVTSDQTHEGTSTVSKVDPCTLIVHNVPCWIKMLAVANKYHFGVHFTNESIENIEWLGRIDGCKRHVSFRNPSRIFVSDDSELVLYEKVCAVMSFNGSSIHASHQHENAFTVTPAATLEATFKLIKDSENYYVITIPILLETFFARGDVHDPSTRRSAVSASAAAHYTDSTDDLVWESSGCGTDPISLLGPGLTAAGRSVSNPVRISRARSGSVSMSQIVRSGIAPNGFRMAREYSPYGAPVAEFDPTRSEPGGPVRLVQWFDRLVYHEKLAEFHEVFVEAELCRTSEPGQYTVNLAVYYNISDFRKLGISISQKITIR